MVHRAGGGQDHLPRPVAFGDKARQVGLGKGGHPRGLAQDCAADGLAGIGDLLQPVEDDVVRRIQRLADLLQDHAALDLDLIVLEQRVQHDVGNHVQRQQDVVLQHAGVVGGHLARGVGVDVAAHILDRLGNLQRAASPRALERHVFEEMGDTVLLGALVTAAGIDPQAQRGGFQAWHPLCDDAQPVGEAMDPDGQDSMLSSISCFDGAEIVGDPAQPFRTLIKVAHAIGKGWPDARRRLDRVGKLGRMRRGQGDHRHRRVQMLGGHLDADGAVRAQDLAGMGEGPGDRVAGFVFRSAAAVELLAQPLQRALADAEPAGTAQIGHLPGHCGAVAVVHVEQYPLEIGRHLNIHGRADRRLDPLLGVGARFPACGEGCRCGWWRSPAGRSAAPWRGRCSRRICRRNCRSAR